MPHHLIPRHCGYRQLKSFQIAQLVYDITVRFATRYIDRHSRTRDQMIQAARSGNWLGVSSSPGQLPGPTRAWRAPFTRGIFSASRRTLE
jgi:hypothetical protein